MNKKTGISFVTFLFLGAAVMLAGCQEMPDSVAEQQENYGDNPIKEEVELQYCTLEQLKQTSMSDITYEPDNMILPDTVDFSEVEAISLLELAFYDNYTEQRSAVAEQLGIENPEWEEESGQLSGNSWIEYENIKAAEYLTVDDNGQISMLKGAFYTELAEEDATEIKKILRYPDISGADDVCSLNQEKVALKDVAAWIEQDLQESLILSHDFDYRVQTVYIRERKNGEDRISALATLSYQGMTLDYFGGGMDWIDNIPKVVQMDAYVKVELDSVGEIGQFANFGQFVINSSQEQETLVSFESAIQLVEQKLSGFQKMEIADIKLLYALYPEYEYQSGTEYYAAPGNLVEARPVYSFMIVYGEDDTSMGIIENNTFCYVNVDMVTGEVTTNMESKGFTLQ